MNIFEITIRIALVLFILYLFHQLYVLVTAYRWKRQDQMIARALERQDV